MRKLRISINAGSAAVKAFKILKAFDPTLELGPSLACLRSGEPIIDVHAEGVGAVTLLERLLELLANIDAIDVPYVLEITDGAPEKKDGQPPVWPTRIGDRNDLVAALKEEKEAEQRAGEEADRHRAWAASPEGQAYLETHARLDMVRDFLRERWDRLGFDDLYGYEKDYLYVWWLYVDTMNGSLHQYFYNSAGDSALQAIDALVAVAANEAHTIVRDAVAVFDSVGGFTRDRLKRQESMSSLPEDAFDDTTERFYNLREDIRAMALQRVDDGYRNDGVSPQITKR
jgi:hypothetical protein